MLGSQLRERPMVDAERHPADPRGRACLTEHIHYVAADEVIE